MSMTATDLLTLPRPRAIEDNNFEALLLDRAQQLNALDPILFDESSEPLFQQAVLSKDENDNLFWRVELPSDAGLMFLALESDPVTKQTEVAAYRELLIRQRINDAIASNLLALSEAADLDQLAAFYGVLRLDGEQDEPFRARIQLSIRGWAPGSSEYYEFQCRSASTLIRDVLVDVPDTNDIDSKGWIYISVMETEGDGSASDALLNTIEHYVNDTSIRLINDTLVIRTVELVPVDLTATIVQLPDAVPGTLDRIRESVPSLFDDARGLGFDITLSFLTALLQQAGVKKSTLNLTRDVSIAANQCAYLRSFEVFDGGVSW